MGWVGKIREDKGEMSIVITKLAWVTPQGGCIL